MSQAQMSNRAGEIDEAVAAMDADLAVLAGIALPDDIGVRATVLASMRAAAERRAGAVTASKRQTPVRSGGFPGGGVRSARSYAPGTQWLATIRGEYRRFPAFEERLFGLRQSGRPA